MDFSGFLIIPLSAIVTAFWMIGSAVLSRRGLSFRTPFAISFALGVIFLEPWRIASFEEAGMFAIMLFLIAIWVIGGCIIGAIPAAVIVSLGQKILSRKQ